MKFFVRQRLPLLFGGKPLRQCGLVVEAADIVGQHFGQNTQSKDIGVSLTGGFQRGHCHFINPVINQFQLVKSQTFLPSGISIPEG